MYKRLFHFVLVILLLLSAQDYGFCEGQSTLRGHEVEEKDYVRYPLITKPEEIDAAEKQLELQFGSRLAAAAYLAENVVSPWIFNNASEIPLFLNILDSGECSETFLNYYHQIRDAAIRCNTFSLNQPKPISAHTLIKCIEAFSLPDKKKQYAVRETLIQIFADMIENYEWGEDTLNYFLNYKAQKGSIYAEYEITRKSVRMSLGQYGVGSTDQLMKKPLAKSNYMRTHKRLKNLISRLPSIGGTNVFELAAMTGFALENDTKQTISFLKEAINRHYNSIGRYQEMKEFMTISNHYFHMQAVGYTRLGFEENTNKEKQKKYWHKALKIWENIHDEQRQKEDLNLMGHRSNVYLAVGNQEKAENLFAKWQAEKANQIKEAQTALAKKQATRASLVKMALQNKQRQERELASKTAPEGHTPRRVARTHTVTETEEYSPAVFPSLPSEMGKEKTKVKRKGVADPSKAKNQPQKAVEQIEDAGSNQLRIEALLKEGSKHYRRFCDLFSIYEEDTLGVRAISISMHHAKKLLDRVQLALNTLMEPGSQAKGVDASKGKGSHAKGQVSNGMEKVVITLSKKNSLLPYQIQNLVDVFIRLGYYPHYLKDTLKKRGMLNPTHS